MHPEIPIAAAEAVPDHHPAATEVAEVVAGPPEATLAAAVLVGPLVVACEAAEVEAAADLPVVGPAVAGEIDLTSQHFKYKVLQ